MRRDPPLDPYEFDPADWSPGKPGRPYTVYPDSPGLRREPWMTDEEAAKLPGRRPGQSHAEWLAARAAYVEGLERKRAAAAAAAESAEPTPAASPPVSPAVADSPACPAFAAEAAASAELAAKPDDPSPEGLRPAGRLRSGEGRAGPGGPPSPRPLKPLLRRQERFCELFVVIGNASRAAWQAGYSFPDSRNQGYRLLRRPDIQARIGELQRGLARNLCLDVETMLGRLESAYHLAIEGERYNAAARIVEVQARIAGHLAAARAVRPPAPQNDDK